MRTAATRSIQYTAPAPVLYLAFDLGLTRWVLAFSTGLGQPPRLRVVPARDLRTLAQEIRQAKRRFGLAGETAVVSCYEAGRDGFWLHRGLTAVGIQNQVVDAGSFEVPRRARRVKTDRVDVRQLLRLLIRAHGGEARVWSVVRVPAPAVEAARQLPRELLTLKRDRARVTNRIKALLALQGVVVPVDRDLVARLGLLRQWDGSPLPRELQARLEREWAKVELLTTQIRALEAAQRQALRTGTDPAARQVRQLIHLCGLGPTGAWLQVQEFFSWRQFHNRREVAALAGLVPAPYDSGATHREQGITKTGNRYMRTLAIELAWGWLRYQPASALSQWYERRFGQGSSRQRRIGIVALARRLLIALWEYLETGAVPEGAALKA